MQIYKVTVTKDSVVQLTSGSLRKFHPSWSPDGKWIAFSAGAGDPTQFGIWVVSSDGLEMRHVYCCSGSNPDWSPQGNKFVFPGRLPEDKKQKLLMTDTDGENLEILVDPARHGFDLTSRVDHPQFSPDGKKVVFQLGPRENEDGEIWVVNTDGSNPKKLVSNGGLEPSWSPDGRQIVYALFSFHKPEQEGNGKLWVMDGDGKNKRQLTF